jgi:hypothetical protein
MEYVAALSSLQEHVTDPTYGPNEVHVLLFHFCNTDFVIIHLILARNIFPWGFENKIFYASLRFRFRI